MPEPIVLMDQPDDNYCEERGWVSTDVDADTARDLLAQFCYADDGRSNGRPAGEPRRVWLAPADASLPEDAWRWRTADDDTHAREFWEFDATDVTPIAEEGA